MSRRPRIRVAAACRIGQPACSRLTDAAILAICASQNICQPSVTHPTCPRAARAVPIGSRSRAPCFADTWPPHASGLSHLFCLGSEHGAGDPVGKKIQSTRTVGCNWPQQASRAYRTCSARADDAGGARSRPRACEAAFVSFLYQPAPEHGQGSDPDPHQPSVTPATCPRAARAVPVACDSMGEQHAPGLPGRAALCRLGALRSAARNQ